MTNQQHPITPPPELVQQWLGTYFGTPVTRQLNKIDLDLATASARWGADQELEACCEWVNATGWEGAGDSLRAARRPKPPSLKAQALQALYRFDDPEGHDGLSPEDIADDFDLIRRALEQLDD